MATVTQEKIPETMPETPASEATITFPDASRTTSIMSDAMSQASQALLSRHPTNSTLLPVPNYTARRGSDSTTVGPPPYREPQSSHRRGPEDYFNADIRKYVQDSGHKSGTILGASARQEMCVRHRWGPRSEVGKALIEGRDADALQSVSANQKVGSWITRRSEFTMSDLHLAAAFGVVEVVEAIIQLGTHRTMLPEDALRKVPFMPFLPIDWAAAGDHVEVVAQLIKSDPNFDSSSVTPLCFAVQSKAYDVADLLLEHGSDPLTRCDYGSPLHRACKANDTVLVAALSSVMKKGKSCICSFQIYYPVPVDHPSVFGLWNSRLLHIHVDPLAWAVFNGCYEAVAILLSHGVQTDLEYSAEFVSGGKRVTHVTALSLGAAKGFEKIVRLLLDQGATSKFKDHAFAAAICNKEAGIARILSDAGARNSPSTKAWAALYGVQSVSTNPHENS